MIRRATAMDIPEIVALADALTREDAGQRDRFANIAWVETEGAARYGSAIDDPTAACFMAHLAGEPIGFISGRLEEAGTFSLARGATIGSLFVHPARRGEGIGERLVAAFLDWAREQGAARVSVSAYASNAGALRFYERVGFAPASVTLQILC